MDRLVTEVVARGLDYTIEAAGRAAETAGVVLSWVAWWSGETAATLRWWAKASRQVP